MAVSILHRVTGDGMTLVALPILLWWLGALAAGQDAYQTFVHQASSWYGIIILVGISWAFFNHLCSGLRHLALDMGAGFELGTNRSFSILSIVMGVALTAGFWAEIYFKLKL